MASIEIPLQDDPRDDEPTVVFGRLTKRQGVVLGAGVLLIMPFVSMGLDDGLEPALEVLTRMGPVLSAIGPLAIAALLSLVGLSKRGGLYFEHWFPAWARDAASPAELHWALPRHPNRTKASLSERLSARRDAREARAAREAELAGDAELAQQFVARFRSGEVEEPVLDWTWVEALAHGEEDTEDIIREEVGTDG